MNPATQQQVLGELENDGLIVRDEDVLRTTRRWQGAMARAAQRLYEKGDAGEDLRIPIVLALLEIYGGTIPDERLADYAEAMLPVEARSLTGDGPT
jgi:hypothetical protein